MTGPPTRRGRAAGYHPDLDKNDAYDNVTGIVPPVRPRLGITELYLAALRLVDPVASAQLLVEIEGSR
jgi:hypothetical protein